MNVADAALDTAQANLEKANAVVNDLRSEDGFAKTQLGVANFNLEQALNNLYVAQAAKEAADKAVAIAFSQGTSALDILEG